MPRAGHSHQDAGWQAHRPGAIGQFGPQGAGPALPAARVRPPRYSVRRGWVAGFALAGVARPGVCACRRLVHRSDPAKFLRARHRPRSVGNTTSIYPTAGCSAGGTTGSRPSLPGLGDAGTTGRSSGSTRTGCAGTGSRSGTGCRTSRSPTSRSPTSRIRTSRIRTCRSRRPPSLRSRRPAVVTRRSDPYRSNVTGPSPMPNGDRLYQRARSPTLTPVELQRKEHSWFPARSVPGH